MAKDLFLPLPLSVAAVRSAGRRPFFVIPPSLCLTERRVAHTLHALLVSGLQLGGTDGWGVPEMQATLHRDTV